MKPQLNCKWRVKWSIKILPVNEIPATFGLVQSKFPTEGVLERDAVTTFKTPEKIQLKINPQIQSI